MPDKVMIHVERLTKDYGAEHPAVDAISFDVRAGEVLGFLGPNGAGKTTTMKILTSFLAPTAGRAQVAGHDVYADSIEVRRRIGYLPEDTPLYKDMTVLEYLDFVCDLRDVPKSSRRSRLKKVVEQCGIGDKLGALIGELSKGYRQRVGLAQAIVHEPEVLILDEPTSGLDPNQIAEIRGVIKSIGQGDGKTVIFSTHILGEVQATCSRIIIISDGKLVADGTPDDLARSSSGASSILLEIGGARGNDTDPMALLRHIDGIEEIKALNTSGWSLSDRPRATQFRVVAKAGVDPRGDIARVIATAQGMDLLQMTPERASLEDVFRKLTTSQGA
jgi:ABC-2 type transport system ATP-binding protein